MTRVDHHGRSEPLAGLSTELTDWDQQTYRKLISRELTEEERDRVVTPTETYPRQECVLAVHWHPEHLPMDLIRQRIDATFPNRADELIIPTQHNQLMSYDNFTGAEVDCYSPEFDRKIQLLIHFENDKLENATVLKEMLAHTFRYRSRQLFEFIDSLIEPVFDQRRQQAAAKTGADEELIDFVQTQAVKLRNLYHENESITPADAVKNKLLTYYIDALRDHFEDTAIRQAQVYVKAVKKIVKREFNLRYFYTTQEIIAEVRAQGGGVVIPHPEQFWPVLLADYDVDGYEVWNPQSRTYTEFLITVVNRQNQSRQRHARPVLIFMGDDCHMGEKVRDPRYRDPEKGGREIGVQPAWDDLVIKKSLIVAKSDRQSVIDEYRSRLQG